MRERTVALGGSGQEVSGSDDVEFELYSSRREACFGYFALASFPTASESFSRSVLLSPAGRREYRARIASAAA